MSFSVWRYSLPEQESKMDHSVDLLQLLRDAGALKDGHFLLSSGRHSCQYVEKFDLLRRPEATSSVCSLIADRYSSDRIDIVVGPTTGGVIIAFEVARQLNVQAGYAERSDDGREFRRGTTFARNARVLVVDDILTTGGSVRETLTALEMHPVEVVGVAVLVDRSGSQVEFGVPMSALAALDIPSWEAVDCPLCRSGIPLVKPGTTPAADQTPT
jgi:orotate phosphoribosyltransferase